MKVRSGFVSNSSSSSFIVAVDGKGKGKTKITLTFEVDLKDYANKVVSSIKELKEWFSYCYCYNPDENDNSEPWQARKYQQCLEAIRSGKTVIFGMFSDEGTEGEETMLCYSGLHGKVDENKIEIIHSEGGY